MKNFRSFTFKEAAKFFSKLSLIDMISGKLILTSVISLSYDELKITISRHLQDMGLKLITLKVNEDEDEFFFEVQDIIPKLKNRNYIEMGNFRTLSFKEVGKLFSEFSSVDMVSGQLILTTKRNLSVEEMGIMISKKLKDIGLNLISFKISDEVDEFFCEVEDIIPPLTKEKNWLYSTVVEFREECKKRELSSLRLDNFLSNVVEMKRKEFLVKEMLDIIKFSKDLSQKLIWKGLGPKTEKELKEVLVQHFKVDKGFFSNTVNENS